MRACHDLMRAFSQVPHATELLVIAVLVAVAFFLAAVFK